MITILALITVPLVLFTLFIPTTKGIRLPLGSFILLKEFIGKPIKIWNIKDPLFFILRMLFAISITLLIINPLDTTAPTRVSIFHPAKTEAEAMEKTNFKLKLILPEHIVDKFNEDVFFLESFVRSFDKSKKDLSVYYAPTVEQLLSISTDAIIFPALQQERILLEKITDTLSYSALESKTLKVSGKDIKIRAFYPIVLSKEEGVSKFLEMEDGTLLAASFKYNGHNVLVWGVGLSGLWGDLGLSGEFIDTIEQFIKGVEINEISSNGENLFTGSGSATSLFNRDFWIMFALIALSIEALLFILRLRAILVLVLFIIPFSLHAEDMFFIDLNYGDTHYLRNTRFQAFDVLKTEIQKRSSVRLAQRFYTNIDVKELESGKLPELPYLFLFGCTKAINVSPQLISAVKTFISRGGIIFSDSCGADKDSAYNYSIEQLAINVSDGGLQELSSQHPLFRSFYLVSWEQYRGVDVSVTTRRTAFIISRSDILNKLKQHDERAIRSSMNIVLYMLSGNYKSDQLHVRHILKRLQKRELFK